MPGFNGKGPTGEGPMTGGARGYCTPLNAGEERRFSEMTGFRRGMAYGRGFRGGYGGPGPGLRRGFASYTENASDELAILKQQLDLINKKIDNLKKL